MITNDWDGQWTTLLPGDMLFKNDNKLVYYVIVSRIRNQDITSVVFMVCTAHLKLKPGKMFQVDYDMTRSQLSQKSDWTVVRTRSCVHPLIT